MRSRSSARLRVLVTAGPTREAIDPVRYLSNESSGRMGFAIAAAAARAGHATVLVAGPVDLPTPAGVRRVDVVSAREMLAACRREFARCDALFMAAAVADYRPRRQKRGKWRKEAGRKGFALLELVENPDILRSLARRKGSRLLVGFALETGNGLERARSKLVRKGADYIVLNGPASLGGARTSAAILDRTGVVSRVRGATKDALARRLVELARNARNAKPARNAQPARTVRARSSR
jgi:phosphopantothenoylcysteine decarboxylase/phosphopantothenate--cysteine ligase